MAIKRALTLTILLLLFLEGCGSPRDKATKEIKTIQSWAAAARMTAEAYVAGAAPKPYASDTMAATAQALEKEMSAIQSSIPDEPRAHIAAQTESLRRQVEETKAAIDASDRARVQQQMGQLSSVEDALAQILKGYGDTTR